MKIDILTKSQAKKLIEKEIEDKFRRETDSLWKYMNKLREEMEILKRR